jgi:hypothetical protein
MMQGWGWSYCVKDDGAKMKGSQDVRAADRSDKITIEILGD